MESENPNKNDEDLPPEYEAGIRPNVNMQILVAEDEHDISLNYKAVSLENGAHLFTAFDITETYVTDDKSVVCLLIKDEVEDIQLLKVSHKIGTSGITICSPAGFLIGDSVTDLKLGCCSIKPTYTLLSKSGKELLILKGKLKCCGCPPTYKIHIQSGGKNVRDLAEVKMDPTMTTSCDILFTEGTYVGENNRNLIMAMAIGILLQGKYGDPLNF